jgi:hypothetical protein
MGHLEVSTTMRYVDVGEDDKRDAIAAVFGAFRRQVGDSAGETGSKSGSPSTKCSDPIGI